VAEQLLKAGFSVEEIAAISQNLKNYAALVGRVFQNVDALHAQVRRQLHEVWDLSQQVSWIPWMIILSPLINPKAPGPAAKPGLSKDAERVLRVLPTGLRRPGRGPGTFRGLSPEEIYKSVRKDGGVFIPGIPTINAALKELEGARMVDSVSGSLNKKGGEYWRNSKGDDYLKTRPSR
jgi:hypothetical protein